MHRFAPAVFAVALGQSVLVPRPLAGQHRAALRVGVTAATGNAGSGQGVEPRARLSPSPLLDADSTAKKLSLGRHMLVGAGIGAAAGYAWGVYSRNRSSYCDGCVPPVSSFPVLGAVAGAAVGTVIGWLVYLARTSPPAS
jgi:hypothetical protein